MAVDIVSNAVMSATTATANAQAAQPHPVLYDNDAASRFSALMSGPAAPQQVQGAMPVAGPLNVPSTSALTASTVANPRALGDLMLKQINSVGQGYRSTKAEFLALIDSAKDVQLSVPDLLRMQLKMTEMSMQVEVISKGVAKVDQHMDQLTKLQ